MIREKRIRSDLRAVGAPSQANFALLQHELHMNEVDYQIWVAYRTQSPVYIVTHEEVPIVSIYHPAPPNLRENWQRFKDSFPRKGK